MELIFEVPHELKLNPPLVEKVYDVAIIGAGPAGMTATVYCSRKKLDTLLVTKNIGGQVLLTSEIENYMGYQYITGKELSEKFFNQISQFPISLLKDVHVCDLEISDGKFSLGCMGGKYLTKSVIITTGKRQKELGIPGEKEYFGRGVAFCATCDAPLFKDKITAVIGGGNSALTAAIDLLQYSPKVYLINMDDIIQGDSTLLDKVNGSGRIEIIPGSEAVEIKGEKTVDTLVIKDKKKQTVRQIAVGGVFIEIGLVPNSDFAKKILRLNQKGEIITDCDCGTSVPGIYAAGDVTNIRGKQIIIASGEGAKAALSVYKYLLEKK